MIRLTRLNHRPLIVNSDLIEHIEMAPDTVIALTTGQKIMVLEAADEVISRIVDFRRQIYAGAFSCQAVAAAGEQRNVTSNGL